MTNSSVSRRQSLFSSIRMVTSSWVFHLFISAAILLLVFMYPPTLFRGDTDTARNYLNTIVSSLSTILALCISIILVAIQMTASNYTHRVLDFYVRLPYNVSLFLVYLVTIMHSFFLMAKIRDPERGPLPLGLQDEMSADLVLLAICFLILLVYMYAVVQLLKPERIIDLILRDYHHAYAGKRYRAALDNVEQICDIAKRAASFSDSVTGMRCMEVMLSIAADLPMPKDAEDPLLDIHQNVVDQWVEIVGVAVKEKETGLLYGVLDALQEQGELYVRGDCWKAAEFVIRAYRHLAFSHFLAEGQVYYTDKVAGRLHELARCAAAEGTRGQTFSIRTWNVIRMIGENTFAQSPSSVSSLIDGFLLSDALFETMTAMQTEQNRVEGTVLYFQLWKSFACVAAMRDVARWAAWWSNHVEDPERMQSGQRLALLIASHVGREEVWQTLLHAWRPILPSEPVKFDAVRADFEGHAAALFDSWPWPLVEAQALARLCKDTPMAH